VIVATTAAFPGALKRIEISGDRGSVVLEEENLKVWSFADMSPEDESIAARFVDNTRSGGGASDPSAIGHAAHAAQFQDFVDAIRSGRAPRVSGAEGRKRVEIILAIYESAKTGKTVAIDLN
jgi:predicted dehydrogenase